MLCTYNLVGIVNPFKTIPDFVIPIFRSGYNYFMQVCDETTKKIDSFEPVKTTYLKEMVMIKVLKNNLTHIVEKTVYNPSIYAFLSFENEVYFGEYDEMKRYLFYFETESSILKRTINEF